MGVVKVTGVYFVLRVNYRRRAEGRGSRGRVKQKRVAKKKKTASTKSVFSKKDGIKRAHSAAFPVTPLLGELPRIITITVHHVHASHTPPRLSTIPPRMLLIAARWQSKLSHTYARPRHGYESLSTRQFSVFAASGTDEIFQYTRFPHPVADTCIFFHG